MFHLCILLVNIVDRLFLLLETIALLEVSLLLRGCLALWRGFILWLRWVILIVSWCRCGYCASKGHYRLASLTLLPGPWRMHHYYIVCGVGNKWRPWAFSLVWNGSQVRCGLAHWLLLAQHLSLFQDHIRKLLGLISSIILAIIVHCSSHIGQSISITGNRGDKGQVIVTSTDTYWWFRLALQVVTDASFGVAGTPTTVVLTW